MLNSLYREDTAIYVGKYRKYLHVHTIHHPLDLGTDAVG